MSVFALGIELDGEGSHPAAWRHANHPPNDSLSGRTLLQKVRAAENAGFTFATFDDSILPPRGGIRARVDAVNRASFVARRRRRSAWFPSSRPHMPSRFTHRRNWPPSTTRPEAVAAG